MTEKEIKACLVEVCKEVCVKSTGRGTVAGISGWPQSESLNQHMLIVSNIKDSIWM